MSRHSGCDRKLQVLSSGIGIAFWGAKRRVGVPEARPLYQLRTMRAALLGLIAAPLAVIGASVPANASPFWYYSSSSPYSSYSLMSGPGGYSGFGYGTGNVGMYSDNYGTTTCARIGGSIMCF